MPALLKSKIDVIRIVLARDVVAEALPLRLVGDVGDERADARRGRRVLLGQLAGFLERLVRYVAGRDVASLGREQPHQFTTHAGATAGNNCSSAREVVHGQTVVVGFAPCHVVGSGPPGRCGAGERAATVSA